MKIKKMLSLLLVAVMSLSFTLVVNAADDIKLVKLNIDAGDQKGGSALNLVTGGEVGLYLNTPDVTCAIDVKCPSWSDNLGDIEFNLYVWEGDYKTSIATGSLYTKQHGPIGDNSVVTYSYPNAPAGEYLLTWRAVGTNNVGVYAEPELSPASVDSGIEQKLFISGTEVTKYQALKSSLSVGKGTLGNLKLPSDGGEDVDIGTDTESNLPEQTIEEKLANSIALYTGSPLAIVNGRTRVIDKFNQEVVPVIINGRTLLPIRFVAENLGAETQWNEQEQLVTITKDETVVEFKIGSNYMLINGAIKTIDVAPQILQNRTMIPIRALSEALDVPICWRQDGQKGMIIIGETCKDIAEDDEAAGTLLIIFKGL